MCVSVCKLRFAKSIVFLGYNSLEPQLFIKKKKACIERSQKEHKTSVLIYGFLWQVFDIGLV